MDTQPVNALSQLLGNMSVQDLVMALKDTQIQNQALKNEIRALRTAPIPIEAVSGPPSAAPVSSPVPTESTDSILNEASGQASILETKESKDKFKIAARRMIITSHVWWEKKNIFGTGQASAQRELDAALALYLQGSATVANVEKIVKMRLVLQLYISLAPQYHVFVGGTIPGSYHKLEKIMKDAAKDIRPTIINWIKSYAAKICEGIVPYDRFQPDFDQYTDLLCRQLVGYEAGKEGVAHLSPATLKILICVLWGGSALRTKKFQTKTTYGGLWEVKEVTPAAIAFAAIALRFLLSGNPSFSSERGANSKINYFSDFEFYVSIIEKKLAKGSKSMLATQKLYNDEVFPNFRHAKSAALNLQANLEENSEEEEILRGLDEVEAEVYSDEVDFTAFADAIDLQVDTQTAPASIVTEDIVEAAPVPLAMPRVTATKGKGGRKKANTSTKQYRPTTACRGDATPWLRTSTKSGARSGTKGGARAVTIPEVIEGKNDDEEASENDNDDGNGNGNGNSEGNSGEDEEEEEEDYEYAH
ncbi:hypothetical protein ARMSODRAFT_1027212 [Armillaria solidipes]|uniref:Uncharacterized protein n=1 Tax=Armillaria solidipes TaxID=1076256 RepID=A0A2H3B9E6_9AGAR|nr:hypothetical protein ARMSODRAFT_1027212 [Armillaria solidipes]